MSNSDRQCPACGGVLATTKSRRVGAFVRRYRSCPKCRYRETILLRPAEIVSAANYELSKFGQLTSSHLFTA